MTITIHVEGLKELMAKLQAFPKELKRAEQNAINTTATAVRKEVFKTAGEIYNINPARLKKDDRGRETTYIERASPTKPYALIVLRRGKTSRSGDRPGLQNYMAGLTKWRRAPGNYPRYKILKGGATKEVKDGFLASGARFTRTTEREGAARGFGLWQRVKGTTHTYTVKKADGSYGKRKGERIVRRTGMSIAQMYSRAEAITLLKERGVIILKEKLRQAIEKQLAKVKRK